MTEKEPVTVDAEKLGTKESLDLILVQPVKDGFCRLFGGYVEKGHTARFLDGAVHRCIATDTFGPPIDE